MSPLPSADTLCASEWALKAEGRANAVFCHVGSEDYIHVRASVPLDLPAAICYEVLQCQYSPLSMQHGKVLRLRKPQASQEDSDGALSQLEQAIWQSPEAMQSPGQPAPSLYWCRQLPVMQSSAGMPSTALL